MSDVEGCRTGRTSIVIELSYVTGTEDKPYLIIHQPLYNSLGNFADLMCVKLLKSFVCESNIILILQSACVRYTTVMKLEYLLNLFGDVDKIIP